MKFLIHSQTSNFLPVWHQSLRSLNQCWPSIVKLALRNKLSWKFNQNTKLICKKIHLNCCLWHGSHFVQTSMCHKSNIPDWKLACFSVQLSSAELVSLTMFVRKTACRSNRKGWLAVGILSGLSETAKMKTGKIKMSALLLHIYRMGAWVMFVERDKMMEWIQLRSNVSSTAMVWWCLKSRLGFQMKMGKVLVKLEWIHMLCIKSCLVHISFLPSPC